MSLRRRIQQLMIVGLLILLALPEQSPALAQGEITFEGTVQSVDGTRLVINGLTVDASSVVVGFVFEVNQSVRVVGALQADGSVVAVSLELLSPPPTAEGSSGSAGGVIVSTPGLPCPLSQGYWKNHADVWLAAELSLGGQVYTREELLALLNLPSSGDASLILARQLIAARLNILTGADPAPVQETLAAADAALAVLPGRLPLAIEPSSPEGQVMIAAGGVLDGYNNRHLTPTCNRANVPVAIVIEGPVTQINVNVITIYNINIELAPDDPNLTVIQIGDVIRVAGDIDDRDGTIIIIAITVVFVNIEVYIAPDNTQIWRDNDNCQNPPPPWAPANGWRRRCDSGGGSGSRS